jgi:ubiquitin-activating enzyme E1
MKLMAASNVLIMGLNGLGVEIAKNVCLAGVKSVTLYDPTIVTLPDLGTQFFLRESDIGSRRDNATLPRISELNAYTPVSVLEVEGTDGQVREEELTKFTVVVLVGATIDQQLTIDTLCHGLGIKFISAATNGLFGSAFCDFGKQFPVIDGTGETPFSGMIVGIENEVEEALITCLDETRHGLEDGDYVRFSEVVGMDINAAGVEGARKVTVKGTFLWTIVFFLETILSESNHTGPYTFTIGDTRGLGNYKSGGWFHQVKMPKFIDFVRISV